jgi:NAD-dependent dihydropyrimidine dehydrogenase PreA subunit
MPHVITEPCIGVKDQSCVDVCPVSAIFPEEDVPREWEGFIQKNAELSGL